MFLFIGESVYACNCPAFGPPGRALTRDQENRKKAARYDTAVFTGVVTALGQKNDRKYFRDITFNVEQFWSGDITKEVVVRSFQPDLSCVFDLRVGASYLVFARLYQNGFYADECYGIQELEYSAADIQQLGKGKVPFVKRSKNK